MGDPSRDVRADAGAAILSLMRFSPKMDALLSALHALLTKVDAEDSANSHAETLSALMMQMDAAAALKLKPTTLAALRGSFCESDRFRTEPDDALRLAAARCVAALAHCAQSDEEREELLVGMLDVDEEDDWRSIEYDLSSLAFVLAKDVEENE